MRGPSDAFGPRPQFRLTMLSYTLSNAEELGSSVPEIDRKHSNDFKLFTTQLWTVLVLDTDSLMEDFVGTFLVQWEAGPWLTNLRFVLFEVCVSSGKPPTGGAGGRFRIPLRLILSSKDDL